jgi:hypothetical protein
MATMFRHCRVVTQLSMARPVDGFTMPTCDGREHGKLSADMNCNPGADSPLGTPFNDQMEVWCATMPMQAGSRQMEFNSDLLQGCSCIIL